MVQALQLPSMGSSISADAELYLAGMSHSYKFDDRGHQYAVYEVRFIHVQRTCSVASWLRAVIQIVILVLRLDSDIADYHGYTWTASRCPKTVP